AARRASQRLIALGPLALEGMPLVAGDMIVLRPGRLRRRPPLQHLSRAAEEIQSALSPLALKPRRPLGPTLKTPLSSPRGVGQRVIDACPRIPPPSLLRGPA